ncbi:MAG: hypothetical protein HN509_15515 [Halobacteriovoraceae bacterium]|jgi:hypothetical protein|nr:hypothetical protein [Halobacteriovoraceae bacterium]MBT5092968.1 hypothetical protein [Halobacteriovoraceae bacterium]
MTEKPEDKPKEEEWPDSESIERCCETGCDNCPWDFKGKVDPNIPRELQDPWAE